MLNNDYYVVAGTFDEFIEFQQKKCKEPEYADAYFHYVKNADTIRGVYNIKGFYYGSYESRKDIAEIRKLITASKLATPIDDMIQGPGAGVTISGHEVLSLSDPNASIWVGQNSILPQGAVGSVSSIGTITGGNLDSFLTASEIDSRIKKAVKDLEMKLESLKQEIKNVQEEKSQLSLF